MKKRIIRADATRISYLFGKVAAEQQLQALELEMLRLTQLQVSYVQFFLSAITWKMKANVQ
jgi:hypothetical protein